MCWPKAVSFDEFDSGLVSSGGLLPASTFPSLDRGGLIKNFWWPAPSARPSAATETSWIPSVCHSTGNLEFGATCKYCIYTGIYVRYCTVYTGTNDNHQHFELALPEALLVHLGQTKSKLNVRIHNCTYKLYEFLGSTKSAISFWPTDLYISASFGRTSLQLPPDSATTSKR